MMSPLEFYLLDIEDKAIVFTEGVFVAEVEEYYRHKVVLYSLHSFWVEVYYHVEDNMIDAIHLASPEAMNKYLNQIKIDTF